MRLFPAYDPVYPIRIETASGDWVDSAGNVETATSLLYGDLSEHDGEPRTIYAPAALCRVLESEARVNADCWDIPVDHVVAFDGGVAA